MVHHNKCPLCSSGMISFHSSCVDHFVSKETFPLNSCGTCGFLFTQDHPNENEIAKYYESDDYISHSDTSRGFINKGYRFVREAMLLRKRGIIKKITGLDEGSLLDIGSGTGYFAAAMIKAGWKVNGVEISGKARDFASTEFGLDTVAPEKIREMKPESFDCMTLWHVLEHFQDPCGYISDIVPLLKPGGVCLIALPNSSSYDARHYRQYWAAFDVPRHLWHFDPATFSQFILKSGMIQEKMMVLPFDVFYISLLSEKYRGSALPLITGFIKAFFFSFLSLFNKGRSSSVIYLLRKPAGQ